LQRTEGGIPSPWTAWEQHRNSGRHGFRLELGLGRGEISLKNLARLRMVRELLGGNVLVVLFSNGWSKSEACV